MWCFDAAHQTSRTIEQLNNRTSRTIACTFLKILKESVGTKG